MSCRRGDARKELAVERIDVPQQPLDGMMGEDVIAGRAGATCAVLVPIERLEDGGGEGGRVAGGDQPSSLSVSEQVRGPPDGGGDDRAAGGHGFDESDRGAFVA